ncbi:BRCT domain-containing protein At4g02110-like isoform X1 [Zingiber officinale]|uniref:BRCT domain-containing protein At4g02110-like isoform X1 n=1 Tax=Zingiber officinale TaxID=94328 RepID=UPI001C4B7AEA|nr:BRCT domain-containing protein At4g02110-like isoform X1 [Zingiber officinale]
MHQSRGATSSSSPDKTFFGVRFVLFGFDSVSEAQCRSELVRRGGIDAGQYDQSCTHVIVCRRVFDDPVCITARKDGKILVNELWVDDSLQHEIMGDANRIIYMPVKDLSGIPGSKYLHICLTGYQKQEREDIMKMASLMGAKFSKSLIANQVTHLICYKFEGEKYELAKKVKIKLVNHRWLEDCLRSWEILPIDSYTKSGWELEILESEAKDSDEEIGVSKNSLRQNNVKHSNFGGTMCNGGSDLSSQFTGQFPNGNAGNPVTNSASIMTSFKNNNSRKSMSGCNSDNKKNHPNAGEVSQTSRSRVRKDSMIAIELFDQTVSDFKEVGSLPTETVSASSAADMKSSALNLSKKPSENPTSVKSPVNISTPSRNFSLEKILKGDSDIMPSERNSASDEPTSLQGLTTQVTTNNIASALPQKRKSMSLPRGDSKSPKSECHSFPIHSSSCNPSPNTKLTAIEALVTPPAEKDHLTLDTNHTLEGTMDSNGSIKKAPASKFKSHYRQKKSLSCGKFVIHKNSSSAHSVSNINNHGISSPKQALSNQEYRTEELSKTTAITDIFDSSSARKALLDLSSNDGSIQVENKQELMNDTGNQFGSVVACKHSDETFCSEKRPETYLGGPGEPELVTTTSNGAVANIGIQNLVGKNNAHADGSEEDQASESPGDRSLVNEIPSSTVNADGSEGNDCKISSGSHRRKVVAKRSVSSRYKLNEMNTSRKENNVLDSDKVVMNTKVVPDKNDKAKVPNDKHISRNLKNRVVEPLYDNEVIKERTEAADFPTPSSIKKDVTVHSKQTITDAEKENMPDEAGTLSYNSSNFHSSKPVNEHDPEIVKTPDKSYNMETPSTTKINLDPAWFILSGHRVQRREFRVLIKRLRGRICRDSHHWSYQATHFITPDPLRRTEKFFAAASAGRWILKTDYLTASVQAGKFLDEEPFEYYMKGLTEDGTISLEAPRKWRLLKERTGHGALYRMRILIYGECIAPSLDTLKRVIKAGDGTILATSPPYTRFLNSGVDYAIVSPSMPRVDLWVQEFLRHEIPCVAADYLVDYICKPGYSLDRHVLYKTHVWAEKSFANLLSHSEEISEDIISTSVERIDDLRCAICGLCDRGEVMLICGDEAGTVGCGIGTHIDCCDPPLESVPQDDWFCSKCNSWSNKVSPKKKKAAQKRKKLSSRTK